MSDNVNIIVQDTINEIVVNSAVIVETIDINVQVAIDEVTIIANPNEYIINVNRIIGEQVQSDWNETDDQAPDYIKNKPIIPSIDGLATVIYVDQQDALKVDKVVGKGLSTNDFTDTLKTKLDGIQDGAEVNVNADWNATSGDAQILNKPIIPEAVTKTSDLINDGEDGVNPFITLEDIPAVTGFVPYTGATQNVDLGEFEIKAGQITLDTSPTGTAAVATTRWNNSIGSSETTLKGGTVVLKNGVDLVARVVNKVTPNQTLTKSNYQAVRVSGATGQRLSVEFAQGNTDLNSADTIGLVTETIATNQEGFIITVGQIEEINTTGSLQSETWADGDVLYLSPTIAGRLTNIKPTGATGHIVVIGYVEYAHAIHGKIYVKIMNGWELDELHNVYINNPLNNDGLFYESSSQLWKNKTIAAILGYTPFQLPSLTSGSVLFSDGTTIAQKNSNFFWDDTNNRLNIGGITSNTARLGIKAPGALSTDIALRVRNSADTGDILTVGGSGILYIDPTNGNGKIQFAAGTGITNTAGVGLNIGQIFASGGAGYSVKLWDNNNTVNYAKFLSSNICFSSTNITTTEASAQFQVISTTKGFLPPRMTTTQKNAIATPASGLVVYDTTLGKLCVRGAAAWETITSI